MITGEFIITMVQQESGVRDLSTKRKYRFISDNRFVAYKLCDQYTNLTLERIGDLIGFDHSSALNGIRKFEDYYGSSDFQGNKTYDTCVKILERKKLEEEPVNMERILYKIGIVDNDTLIDVETILNEYLTKTNV